MAGASSQFRRHKQPSPRHPCSVSPGQRQRTPQRSTKCRCASETAGPQLTVVGSLNVDLSIPVERMPKPGETVSGSGLDRVPGGKGANQAAAAGRLECDTRMVGQVGDDAGGTFMRDALGHAGVSTQDTVATIDGVATGTAVVLLQPGGENSIVIVGGANTAEWAWPEATRAAVTSADAVLLQREVPEATNLMAARMCADAGVPVTLDAGGAEGPLPHELCECLTTVSPNETELARLVGMATGTRDEVVVAARRLQEECGGCDVLVKLGAQGCLLLLAGGDVLEQGCAHVDNVVDTTGAGDCFTAAYTVARLREQDAPEALKYATAAAALCIQQAGAMPSMPSARSVEDMLQRL